MIISRGEGDGVGLLTGQSSLQQYGYSSHALTSTKNFPSGNRSIWLAGFENIKE
jgi:hypothetical protein